MDLTETDIARLDDKARGILMRNDRGGYTVPTAGLYPYQWNWDSAFAAWGFATFDIDRAWIELETLFSGQWETGMVPHIIFHQSDPGYFPGPDVWGTNRSPMTSGISQPPVAATMARIVYEYDPDFGRERLASLYPGLLAWHRWWRDCRCPTGVAAVTHPWESGRDNCAEWDVGMAAVDGSRVQPYTRRDTGHVDPSMRPGKEDYDRYIAILEFGRNCGWDQQTILKDGPFLMADPAITFILIRANRDLAAIARLLGEDPSEPETWAEDLVAALPTIWNEDLGCYDAKDLRSGTFANCLGSGAFLGWLAGIDNPRMEERLMQVWDGVRFGVPSNNPDSYRFEPRRYWRGPSWPVVNALITLGLTSAGRTDLAERLRRETVALITAGGFYEYFDPVDGTPCGGDDFTWTAAIWLGWASPSAGEV